jgi:hypothetical protein
MTNNSQKLLVVTHIQEIKPILAKGKEEDIAEKYT